MSDFRPLEDHLIDLLAHSPTIALATTGGPVSPWIAAAYFAEDGPFVLELMLEASGTTLANMRARPEVAVMIEHGDAFSLFAQGKGRASVGGDDDAARVRAAIAAKTPVSAPLVALPALVPVRIEIDRWKLTDVPAGWLPARELRRAAPGARPET